MSDKFPLSPRNNSKLRSQGYRFRDNGERVTSRDRMQPVLLDLLTDDEPQKKKEAQGRNLLSHGELRKSVLRDLQWLFNCVSHESTSDLSAFPHVRRSTINYGITSLAGKRMSDIEWADIQRALTETILHFEPRILSEGLQVRCLSDTGSLETHNVLTIEIKGQLWCEPYPLDFLFRTDVDLENGHFEMKDLG
ncbi:type VI secretion system baseplate subunit TssE [Enterobacillus tribolii]|uniref:Type VI secretion system protein ImpF n=1 Tax=Enterobacillus tribolii TaxID=1487935 RepID=A0A370Q6Z4_9GAMM|nr:type VI secretion system baseplate subunit TssE [Enterobacillus tribolii]MBW7984919.1 type VI secretion system baseplate subunit TssE [Enterobacillus tribolii]RDK84131.1 type VI secretion system protein ImpF [Enterobacillus tribolii]